MTIRQNLITRVSWQEVSEEVKGVNPDLWEKLNPVMKRLTNPYFYIADYPYGELIVNKGEFSLPPGQIENPEQILTDLNYSSIPLCLVLDKSVEVFIERSAGYLDESLRADMKRTIPLRMINKGELFGVFETLDALHNVSYQKPPWSVSSGAITTIVLSDLGNKDLRNKLRTILKCSIPDKESLFDWRLIKCANDASINSDRRWDVRVLIFPSWIIQDGEDFARLQNIIGRSGWQQTVTIRDYLIEESSVAELYMTDGAAALGDNKNALFHYFTVRHLLALSKGDLPALHVVKTKEAQAGPFALLQEALLKTEKLKFFPYILQPVQLNETGADGFYSIGFPTLIAPTPNQKPYRTKKAFFESITLALHNLKKTDMGRKDLLDNSLFNLEKSEFYNGELKRYDSARFKSRTEIDDANFIVSKDFISPDYSHYAEKVKKLHKQFDFFHCAIRIVRK